MHVSVQDYIIILDGTEEEFTLAVGETIDFVCKDPDNVKKFRNLKKDPELAVRLFLVFIRIRWIRTGSHPCKKTMSSIALYPAFYEYKDV